MLRVGGGCGATVPTCTLVASRFIFETAPKLRLSTTSVNFLLSHNTPSYLFRTLNSFRFRRSLHHFSIARPIAGPTAFTSAHSSSLSLRSPLSYLAVAATKVALRRHFIHTSQIAMSTTKANGTNGGAVNVVIDWPGDKVRHTFIDFFQKNGHTFGS